MQDFCHFFTAGDQLHVLSGDPAQGNNRDEVLDHRRGHRDQHTQGHTGPAPRADESGCQSVHAPGRRAHQNAADAGPDQDAAQARILVQSKAHEHKVP